MSRPLSVQLYTLREEMTDRAGTLRRLSDIGYGAVEPYNPTDDPAGFRALADEFGLVVSATHSMALINEETGPGPTFEAAEILGTDKVILPAGIAHEDFATRDGLARAADLLNSLAEQAAAHDLSVGYHNHWWEFEPVLDGRHGIEVLADLLAPEVFLEIDTYWAAVGGADVPAVLGRLGDRVQAIHVKDGPLVKGEPHVAVGAGKMPVREVLAAVPHAQRVVELDECAGDMWAAVTDSHAFLATLGEDA